jgi:hypothetical protein
MQNFKKIEMNSEQYLEIILVGLLDHKDFLTDHFYREAKKAKEEYIKTYEFFNRLQDALNFLISARDNQFNSRLRELELIKAIEIEDENEAHRKLTKAEIERQRLIKEDFSVNLYHVTNHKFNGFLYQNDFNHIATTIDAARLKCNSEQFESQKPKVKMKKAFPEYLLHENRELLAQRLKEEFKTERGKGIRLMFEALQLNEPPLLTIENRQRKAIWQAMNEYFMRDIGTYQSIFDYKFDEIVDKVDFKAIKTKLDFILRTLTKDK